MAEDSQKKDENNQSSAAASSTAADQNTQATPPAGERPVAEGGSENRIPQSRFNEVVEQRNRERQAREAQEAKVRELERIMSQAQAPAVDPYDAQIKRLVTKLNLKEDAAREIVTVQAEIAEKNRKSVEAGIRAMQFEGWTKSLESEHKDWKELMPEMDRIYSSLPPESQAGCTASKAGLSMLYSYAKASVADKKTAEAFEAGKNQAYGTKGLKEALASGAQGTASGTPSKLTVESIKAMSLDEYKKRLPEINKALMEGSIT